MNLKRFAPVLTLLLLLAPALFAAEDLTGKWGGTLVVAMDANPPKNDTAVLVLKQTGTTLTGTAGPNESAQDSGTVKGEVETVKKDGKEVTNVTLEVAPTRGDLPLRFVMTLADGHLKGNAQAEMDGRKLTAVMDVTRLKK